jgi:hypothetical protein
MPNVPIPVKTARWKSHMALIDDANCSIFECLLNEAASELSFGHGVRLHEHQLVILQFLVFIANRSAPISSKLAEMNFARVLMDVLTYYPNHTIGHQYIQNCLLKLRVNPVLGPHAYQIFPCLADAIAKKSQLVLSATATGFFVSLVKQWQNDANLQEIISQFVRMDHPCWVCVREAGLWEEREYGGPLPAGPLPGQQLTVLSDI